MLLQDDCSRPPPATALTPAAAQQLSALPLLQCRGAAATRQPSSSATAISSDRHSLQEALLTQAQWTAGLPAALPPAKTIPLAAGWVQQGMKVDRGNGNGGSGVGDSAVGTRCGFGWDNEQPMREVWVDGCAMQNRPVTVGEYFRFLQQQVTVTAAAGGGGDDCRAAADADPQRLLEHLLPGSWQWVAATGTCSSLEDSGSTGLPQLGVRSVMGPVPLAAAWHWPAHVSREQALLYAAWASGGGSSMGDGDGGGGGGRAMHRFRLPTEPELLLAAAALREQQRDAGGLPGGAAASGDAEAGWGFQRWCPVDVPVASRDGSAPPPPSAAAAAPAAAAAAAAAPSAAEFVQLRSNSWEWTDTLLAPHPRFQPSSLYPECESWAACATAALTCCTAPDV